MNALWLFDQGVQVFPLKPRSKEPACYWQDFRPTRADVARFINYGVPLGLVKDGQGLAVIDTDTTESEAWAVDHVPPTPFMVTTGRGLHRYYRIVRPVPKFIHRDGHTIECRNQGQYVVGPGSYHPSGSVYQSVDWSWRWHELPFLTMDTFNFEDGSCGYRSDGGTLDEPYSFPDGVAAGERHHELFKFLRSLKASSNDNPKELVFQFVKMANRKFCRPPVREDYTFERWLERAWNNPDRPMPEATANDPFEGDDL